MSGVLYNAEVEQEVFGVWTANFYQEPSNLQDLLDEGWQLVSISSTGSGDDGFFVIFLERRKKS